MRKFTSKPVLYPDNEWEHPLSIVPPGHIGANRLLEFQDTIYRLEGDTGFLSMCIPTRATLPEIEKQYGLLIEEYGDNAYIQLDDPNQDTIESNHIPIRIWNPLSRLLSLFDPGSALVY